MRPRLLAVAVLWLAASACAPLYLPPEPRELPPIEARLHLAEAEATVTEGLVRVSWTPRGVTGAGWLAVQWFPPSGGAVAAQSVWLDADEDGVRQGVTLPPEVALRPGRWRAVLSFDGRVLRQVAWSWPPGS